MFNVKKAIIYVVFGMLPTFCLASDAAAAAAASEDHDTPSGVSIGYANIGGHVETIGGLLKVLKGNQVNVVAELKKSCLDGSLKGYHAEIGGEPPLGILIHKGVRRGDVSLFKSAQRHNTRPFFYGIVKVSATRRVLLCGIHLKSGHVARADRELAEIKHILATEADSARVSDIIIVGDFNRATAEHAGTLDHYEPGTIYKAGGHSHWDLDRIYYFHKVGEEPLHVDIEASAENNYDHGHVGFRINLHP